MLNIDFFDVIRKQEEQDLINHFGPKIGKLLKKQGELEDQFQNNCMETMKMKPIDDEGTTEEERKIALDVKANIKVLVRHFSEKQNQLKLKVAPYNVASSEFTVFYQTFEDLKKLYNVKLTTPKEEMN
jgi:hypothetical protein